VHDEGYFDERAAATYDESGAEMFDPTIVDPVVDFLAELAGNGRALELGIGTGRIAGLPPLRLPIRLGRSQPGRLTRNVHNCEEGALAVTSEAHFGGSPSAVCAQRRH
jgi:hypothetical protein